MRISGLARSIFNPLQRYARARGVMITKYPSQPLQGFPVFPLVVTFLNHVKGGRLTFIHVGANDGGDGDPLSGMAKPNAWTGILIEPQPDVFDRLVHNYHGGVGTYYFENLAIAPRGQTEVIMHRAKRSDAERRSYERRADLSASIDPVVTAGALGKPQDELDSFRIPCTTLDALVTKHGLSELDVLLIDAEGFDDKVLMTLDLSKTQPLVIQFETTHLSTESLDHAMDYVQSAGYRVLYLHPQYDSIAVHPRCLDLLGIL